MDIKIEYDGSYPNLCSGKLVITINSKIWRFPNSCLSSGGRVYFNHDYSESYIEEGDWSIYEWPGDFPEEYKELVLEKVNNNIPKGCCGGCI